MGNIAAEVAKNLWVKIRSVASVGKNGRSLPQTSRATPIQGIKIEHGERLLRQRGREEGGVEDRRAIRIQRPHPQALRMAVPYVPVVLTGESLRIS